MILAFTEIQIWYTFYAFDPSQWFTALPTGMILCMRKKPSSSFFAKQIDNQIYTYHFDRNRIFLDKSH